jgi:hypothetical protein
MPMSTLRRQICLVLPVMSVDLSTRESESAQPYQDEKAMHLGACSLNRTGDRRRLIPKERQLLPGIVPMSSESQTIRDADHNGCG